MDITGRIFDIQRFSIHDGDGIRTVVFLKGCCLRCKWCCNPEGQKYDFETMNINGKCKNVGQDIAVSEVMAQVMRDMPYYRRSKGGITLSGGEVLMQSDFAAQLLKSSKEHGLTTAIESTGCANYSEIQKLLPYLDTYLMDIKHINSDKHKKFTGKSNELILENARKIVKENCKLIIRVPVIPTFNDSGDEIKAIAQFAKNLDGVQKLHLLPYHKLGTDKYSWLGREYEFKDIASPTKTHMEMLKEIVIGFGLDCQIGG